MDLKFSVLALTVCLYTVLQDQVYSASTVPGTTVTDPLSTNTLPAGGGSATVSSTNKGPDKHTTPKPKAVTSTHALTTTPSTISCFNGTCTGNTSCINRTMSSTICTAEPNKGCFVQQDGQNITAGCTDKVCDISKNNKNWSCCLKNHCNFQIHLNSGSWITRANSVFYLVLVSTAMIFTIKQT